MERTEREVRAARREYLVKEWVTEELTYSFAVKRASLASALDPVRVPLAEAAGIIANHLSVSIEMGLDIIVEAAATKRIRVYGTPEHKWQGDRIRARVWRKIGRGEARFSTEPSDGGSASGSWSNPYVFRADLEQLLREVGDGIGSKTGAKVVGDCAERETSAELANGRRAGRAPADFWEEAEGEAMRWLQDNGFPAPNDGNQAKLERHILDWLAERKHEASEATVRRHVRRCIARYRDQIGAEDQNAMK